MESLTLLFQAMTSRIRRLEKQGKEGADKVELGFAASELQEGPATERKKHKTQEKLVTRVHRVTVPDCNFQPLLLVVHSRSLHTYAVW